MQAIEKNCATALCSFMTFRIVLIAVGACITALAACSTTEGFGEDVKKLGGNIEDSAERNK